MGDTRDWHVKQENGWDVVQSENDPGGALSHLAQETCGNWDCGHLLRTGSSGPYKFTRKTA